MPTGTPRTQTSAEAFKLQQFGGMLPAWDDHLIPDGQSVLSQNGYLFSGALAGWRTPKLLHAFQNGGSKFAYRLPNITQNIANAIVTVISNALDGDQVTLGEEVYTFRNAISQAYDVQIGATTALTATNFFCAITIDNGSAVNQGTLYGIGTVANPAIDQTSPVTKNILATGPDRVEVFAPSTGAAYNSTLVADNTGGARLKWTYNGAATTTFQGGTNLTFDASITGASTWVEFADPDTDVMRSPVVDDLFDRFYFASPSVAPTYNTRARMQAGQPAWLLGVPAPGCSPGVVVTGGGDTLQLGYPNSLSSGGFTPGANEIYLVPITPTGAASLNDVSFMPTVTNPTCNYAAVVYSDNNGTPANLVGTGQITTGVIAGTAALSAFVNPPGLLMNTQYWIGMIFDSNIGIQLADNTGLNGVVSNQTFTNGPPPVINNLAINKPDLQLWGDLTSSSVLEARAYVYTYISAYGEESPPSPATIVTGWSNGTWTVSLFQPPPDQLGITRNLVGIRLYRTISGVGGSTTYFQVTPVGNAPFGDLLITTPTYVDTNTDDLVATNTQLASQLWTPPPEDLQGMVSMPNGMIVGWRANEIWFCEPYRPHAWPGSYVLTTEYPIVGLGVTGSSVVACTSGSPYIASGSSPAAMTAQKIQVSEPCHSRGSILGNNDGVYYTSPNGLILVTQFGSVTNTSELWITREKWQQNSPQKNLRSVFLVSSYFSMGTVRNGDNSVAQQGFTIELNASDAQSFSIWPQPGGHRLGFNKLTGPNQLDVYNVRLDPWSAVCLVMQGTGVYYYDFSDPAPVMQTYKWRSKLFQQRSKKNFSAMRIWFDIPPGTPAQSATRNTAPFNDPSWNALAAGQYGIIRVYAGGNLVMQREIRNIQELLRIPSGFKNETWQFEVEARVPISNIQIGTSVKAMAQT
jgi:hypothetical protein